MNTNLYKYNLSSGLKVVTYCIGQNAKYQITYYVLEKLKTKPTTLISISEKEQQNFIRNILICSLRTEIVSRTNKTAVKYETVKQEN